MAAVAHGWHKPGGGGPSKAVAQEFAAADKGKKFKQGGVMKHSSAKKASISPAMLAALAGPAGGQGGPMAAGPGGPPGMPPGAPPPGMSHGGEVHHHVHHHYAKGGRVVHDGKVPPDEVKPTKKFSSPALREKKDTGDGVERKAHTKGKVMRMADGGHIKAHHRGDGIAQRGHTKGHSY